MSDDTAATVDLLTPSAPERIWLCISDDEDHYAEPFPACYGDEVTWSSDKPCACTVEYVRADIAREARREALEEAAWVCDRLAADMDDDGARPAARAAWDCASAIHALADAPDAGAGG